MKFAVLSADRQFVDNVIVAKETQQAELEASPLGLTVGDYYNGSAWTRNVDGEQVTLPLDENPDVTAILNLIEEGE